MSDQIEGSPQPQPAKIEGIDWLALGSPRPDPFTLRLTVGPAHLSRIIPHVPNTTFVQWLESMAVAHSDSLGFDDAWHRQRDLIWFVRRHEIDYLAEVLEGDYLAMATWVEGFNKTSSPRRYLVYRPRDSTVVCRAMTVWVLMSRHRRRPQRIDPEVAAEYLR